MNIEKHRVFIESLEGEKGLPDEWRLLVGGEPLKEGDEEWVNTGGVTGYWKRCALPGIADGRAFRRRAESHQIPDLKEKVKELMRDAMDAEYEYCADGFLPRSGADRCGFRALCEPDKGAEVKP